MIITMASKATALRSALCFAVIVIAVHGSDNHTVAHGSDNILIAQTQTCVYSVYVRTGQRFHAGTDSNISLAVGNAEGVKFSISNLVAWGGLMGQNYNYFEVGNLDIFSGRGACLNGPICSLELFSDGTGPSPGWYCEYVVVSSTGPDIPCDKENFIVDKWLATESPYQLSFSTNLCHSSYAATDTIVM